MSSSDQLISDLHLLPHPEGGYYAEIHRSAVASPRVRAAMTSIYFLLTKGDVSRWHMVDADEAWHFYEGDAIELYVMPPDFSHVEKVNLGLFHVATNTKPVYVVPAGWWQASRSSGEYSLCGCTVAPGFEFGGFRMMNNEEKSRFIESFDDLAFLV